MEEIEINTEELDNLLVSYKNCADGKKKRVLHLNIVEKSMFLVKKIAMTLAFQFGMSTEDLIQVGSIGLIKAIEMYDCQKNTRFKTYASYFIRGEIRHYIRDKGPIIKAPREHRDMFLRVSAAIKALKEQGFDEPSEEQIANEAGLPLEKINEVLEIEHCNDSFSRSGMFH